MAEIKNVVDKLAELTEQGRVPWRPTVDKSTFAATFGRMSVLISIKEPFIGSDKASYRLSVLDEKGDEIDYAAHGTSVTGVSLPALLPLYESAKRTALGVEERLEELLDAMDRVSDS